MAYGTAKVDTLQTSTKTVQVDDLAVSADLGTAAAEDVGTSAGNVVQLDGSARLPAVDGSQLTGLPSATGTDLSYTASTRVLASSTGTDATLPEATTSEAGLLSAADKTKLNGIAAADAAPQPLGVAAVGVSTDYAREDHVHAMPSAADVGADPAGTASSEVGIHAAAADPHPGYALESSLAAVATSGAYGDLSGTPTIPVAADATPQALGTAAIGISTDYAREDHVHQMPSAANVGADPAGTATSAVSSHEAAADPHPGYALESNLAAVATSGAYADLSGTPTLVSDLGDLGDVTLTSPSDGQVLEYDSGTSTWVNATPSGGGGTPGGSDTQVQYNDGGSFAGDSGLTYDATPGALTVGGKTITADAPVLNLSQTWNNAGVTFTGLKLNVTNTASASGSSLLDLQVGGTSAFNVYPIGAASIGLSTPRSNFNITSVVNINLLAPTVRLLSTSAALGHSIGISGLTTSRDVSFSIAPVDSTSGSAIDGASITIRGQNRTNTSATLANGGHVYLIGGNAPSGNPNPFSGGNVYLDSGLANSGGADGNIIIGATRGNLQITDARDVLLGETTGTKIGTAATQKLGFFGVTPVVQQTELTDELTTITHTAPGTPDYAIQDLTDTGGFGFASADEGNTVLSVIANLQTRVNELEAKLVALGLLADAD